MAVGDFNRDGYDDLAIGVPYEDVINNSVADGGAVDVVYGASSGLTRVRRDRWSLIQSDIGRSRSQRRDHFGFSLAAGDFNGDGYDDLAIGVPHEDVVRNSISDAGAIDIAYGAASGLTRFDKGKWSIIRSTISTKQSEKADYFGQVIATGDFNGDGFGDLAAPTADRTYVGFFPQLQPDALEVALGGRRRVRRDRHRSIALNGDLSGFDIRILFPQNSRRLFSPADQALFNRAAEQWEQIILSELPDVLVPGFGWVDDLVIEVTAVPIDGTGGTGANAQSTILRPGTWLPAAGVIRIDTANLGSVRRNGTFEELILHEIGHVLGVGGLWRQFGLLQGAGTSDPRFVGPRATAEFNRMVNGRASGVPVENRGGGGTRDGHWRQATFGNELMTGSINDGAPISRITIASLADMGYAVDLSRADPYALSRTTNTFADDSILFGVEYGDPLNSLNRPQASPVEANGLQARDDSYGKHVDRTRMRGVTHSFATSVSRWNSYHDPREAMFASYDGAIVNGAEAAINDLVDGLSSEMAA